MLQREMTIAILATMGAYLVPCTGALLIPMTKRQIKLLEEMAKGVDPRNDRRASLLRRQTLEISGAYCNDGSTPRYYISKTRRMCNKNDNWVIYLQGGWYCFNRGSCLLRGNSMKSSVGLTKLIQGKGILSSHARENPNFYRHNFVYIPYCSSDLWTGTRRGKSIGLHFQGRNILTNVVKDLYNRHGLNESRRVTLTGTSAGGIGVMHNIDLIGTTLRSLSRRIKVQGIVDSGWFLNYRRLWGKKSCKVPQLCPLAQGIKMGIKLWNSSLSTYCRENIHSYRCFSGPVMSKTITSPLFVMQDLYDPIQANVVRGNLPIMNGTSLDTIASVTRLSFPHNIGVFAASCRRHGLMHTKSTWKQSSVNSVPLQDALRCWILKTEASRKRRKPIPMTPERKGKIMQRKICRNHEREYERRSKLTPNFEHVNVHTCLQRVIDRCGITQNETCNTSCIY